MILRNVALPYHSQVWYGSCRIICTDGTAHAVGVFGKMTFQTGTLQTYFKKVLNKKILD